MAKMRLRGLCVVGGEGELGRGIIVGSEILSPLNSDRVPSWRPMAVCCPKARSRFWGSAQARRVLSRSSDALLPLSSLRPDGDLLSIRARGLEAF